MKRCPVCETDIPHFTITCECGYHFEKEQIVDQDKIRALRSKLEKSKQWIEEVRLKKRVTEVQQKKLGRRWPQVKTSELLGETKGLTSKDIELAEGLDQYPQLLECKNKSQAKKRLNEIMYEIRSGETFGFEEDLQKHLEANWDKIPFFAEWKLQRTGILKGGEYNTGEVGEMDLLARHRKEDRWLVIELKKDESSDTTVGQILRYMGWVKRHLANNNEKNVEGLIISRSEGPSIRYALAFTPNIKSKVYSLKNGKLSLLGHRARFEAYLKTLSRDELKELSKALKGENDKSD